MITWFTAWLARLVTFGGELAGKLVAGILAALAAPFTKQKSKEEE